ncbi:MAG TPA: FmdB family zinc ribbon protein [Burkholderiaceae bacterium]|nr:FmdB family zinc ribbon protein [Burkholderiaceae bacterium]
MPIYAYKCACCQHELDVLQKISDPPLTICPRCGAAGFAKQLTAAGFQLKGSGWYVTDFKNGSAANAKAAAKPEEAKSGDSAAAPAKEPATPKDAPAKASSTAAADGAAASSN